MTDARTIVPRLFRHCGVMAAALVLPACLSGCFIFIAPDRPEESIPRAGVRDRHYYRLNANDSFSCMRIHLPELAERRRPVPAAVIFPGGAYGVLAIDREGNDFAAFLNRHGIAGIVVKYPLGSLFGNFSRHPAMINAAQRAIRQVRYHSAALGIDPERIGVMGSSAGGHLAGLTAVWPNSGDPEASDPVERVSARPDFVILCYPVVTMDGPCAHPTSLSNLLGRSPEAEMRQMLSLEKRITPDCPPFFLWLTLEDKTVDPRNSLMLVDVLKRNHVPYRACFYPRGPHGMGMLDSSDAARYPEAAKWPEEMLSFMREQRILNDTAETTE